VTVEGECHARIGKGFVILLGIRKGDTPETAIFLANKCSALRVFEDARGKMNLSLQEVDGAVLVVSQFTLYADALKGNRPGFSEAAGPEEADPLYQLFVERMKTVLGPAKVHTGVFRAMMDVGIVNDGPVTIMIEKN
jgi:D-tyrosyl-tRNA(Tyr) deacylase